MVEIALCLAIVGFALVAIIAALPEGMNVQMKNRQETIINQDAAVWTDTIRNGARGLDDLTNYVTVITNFWTHYEIDDGKTNITSGLNEYSLTNSHVTLPLLTDDNTMKLTNGARIVGLLSTPKYLPLSGPASGGSFTSNYVVAYVRAMSGSAVEKAPQKNEDVLSQAFTYRMVVEITPYVPEVPLDTNSTVLDVQTRNVLWNNSRDLRLLFRWPALPNGTIGNGYQPFRSLTGGQVVSVADPMTGHPLYFFEPSTYFSLPPVAAAP
ncbi:MAG TPA: hypothetical protein VK327_12900 [Candidatus Paceibacterota bacterium]|nr:hypothetical protein [Candidatus Paceibacterota bacterium]